MRSLFFLIFYSSIIFPRGGEHEFDAVFLVDFGRGRVVVDRDDVGVLVHLFEGADGALARDVVGQAAERLGADDVFGARFRERRHLGGDEPAFPHLHALVDDLVRTAAQVLEVVQRLETVRFGEADDLFLHAVQIAVHDAEHGGGQALFVVELRVVDVVHRAVHDEIHQGGDDRFAALGEQELFEMRVAERGVLDVNFADDADLDLLLFAARDLCKAFEHFAGDRHIMQVFSPVEGLVHRLHALFARGGGGALFQLVGLALVEQRHERIAVKDGEGEL